jgi:hypothetical protein
MVCPVPVSEKREEVMENRPHIMLSSRNIPADIEDKYFNWYDSAYIPLYMNVPGYIEIDNYKIMKKTLDYPDYLSIHHVKNLGVFKEWRQNPVRNDMQKDVVATFYRVTRAWHDVYSLMWAFKSDISSEPNTVDDAPIIHLEGYRVLPAEHDKYEQWFMKWASRLYIPLLMKIPGLKAYNYFHHSDFSMRLTEQSYLEAEIAPYISILYFDNPAAYENYKASLEYAVFKRNMELELSGGISKIWDVEYQIRKSWRM